ncbi:MAG: PP2C family serine/threonine-protein phosphatase [Pirellulales bacterium]
MGATLSPIAPPRAIPVPQRKLRAHLESLLVAEGLMSEVLTLEIAGGMAAVFSTRSPQKTTPNEDVAAVLPCSPKHGVLAVADGLGGHAGGERASKLSVETIEEAIHDALLISPDPDNEPLRPAILDGIEAANSAVRAMGNGAATTLSLVEIQGRMVRAYQVGDSAILLAGQRGKLKYQTSAHSPIGYAVKGGFLAEEEAIHHEERHMISNVIGSEQMHVEMGPTIEMAARDTLVLASDGLLDNLLPVEIVDLVRTGPLDRAVGQLAAVAQERMNAHAEADGTTPSKPDDLTIIAFRPM